MLQNAASPAVTATDTDPPAVSVPSRDNGLTEERLEKLLAGIERRKNDPAYVAYVEELMEGVAAYRRFVQEEEERDWAAETDDAPDNERSLSPFYTFLKEQAMLGPTTPAPVKPQPIAPTASPHGYASTEERIKDLMSLAGRRKGNPSMNRLMEEVDRYREQLRQEEIAAQEAAGGNSNS